MNLREERGALDQRGNRLVSVILPAYNEEKGVGKVIDEIRTLPFPTEIIVIDNNSSDDTWLEVINKGVKPIMEKRQGKGYAVRRGFEESTGDYVALLDADGSYPAFQLFDLLTSMLSTGADIGMGWRVEKDSGSMPLTNRFGNWFLTQLANTLYLRDIGDLCTGMWVFKGHIGRPLLWKTSSPGFTLEAEMFIHAVKSGHTITGIPIRYRKREGEAKLRVGDGFKIAWELIKGVSP